MNRTKWLEFPCRTYISEKYAPFLEHFRLIVVIDFEPREENLVFVAGQSACEFVLSSSGVKSALLDQCPKSRVVEVVDVAYGLVSLLGIEEDEEHMK